MHKELQCSIEKREGLTGNPLILVGTEGVNEAHEECRIAR